VLQKILQFYLHYIVYNLTTYEYIQIIGLNSLVSKYKRGTAKSYLYYLKYLKKDPNTNRSKIVLDIIKVYTITNRRNRHYNFLYRNEVNLLDRGGLSFFFLASKVYIKIYLVPFNSSTPSILVTLLTALSISATIR
jgi:hypothetical protein